MSADKDKMLQSYCASVRHPDAHGIEHDYMLYLRDGLHDIADQLTADEREALEQADRQLVERAADFLVELSRFVDLDERRRDRNIPPTRWWWYLDVLAQLPGQPKPTPSGAQPVQPNVR